MGRFAFLCRKSLQHQVFFFRDGIGFSTVKTIEVKGAVLSRVHFTGALVMYPLIFNFD